MAIEKDQLVEILNGSDDIDAKADALLNAFNADTEYQLNAIKINKEQILQEKRDSETKRKALEDEKNSYLEKIKSLEKQVSEGSPDEVKKIYESRLSEASNIHEKKVQELNAEIEGYKSEISDLKKARLKLDCMGEFNKAIAGKNIAPDAMQDLADFVLGNDCCKFDYRSIGEGKSVIATTDGVQIQAAVNAALETSFGKRCVVYNGTGGGAEGADRTVKGGKTIDRANFESLDPASKMRLMTEGYKIV